MNFKNMKNILLSGKNSNGYYTIVDDEDYNELNQYSWYYGSDKYARRTESHHRQKTKHIAMHRQILKLQNSNIHVDHINHNRLDNRKENLRVCTKKQNMQNVGKKYLNTTSIYKGVCKPTGCKYWRATIDDGPTTINIGRFIHEIDAAEAYDFYAIQYHKEFVCLNFPNKDYTNFKINKREKINKYRGVCRSKNKWTASLYINKTRYLIGLYKTEIEAAEHYDYVCGILKIRQNLINFKNKDYSNYQPTCLYNKIQSIIDNIK